MKSAEQWADEQARQFVDTCGTVKLEDFERVRCSLMKHNKQIQLDAMREGMRRAAEEIYADGNPLSAKTRILKKADQLNDKDL